MDIKFINVEAVEETEMSQLKWMAPEKLEANVMPVSAKLILKNTSIVLKLRFSFIAG